MLPTTALTPVIDRASEMSEKLAVVAAPAGPTTNGQVDVTLTDTVCAALLTTAACRVPMAFVVVPVTAVTNPKPLSVRVPVMVPVAAEDVAWIWMPVTVNCSTLFGSQPVILTANDSFTVKITGCDPN